MCACSCWRRAQLPDYVSGWIGVTLPSMLQITVHASKKPAHGGVPSWFSSAASERKTHSAHSALQARWDEKDADAAASLEQLRQDHQVDNRSCHVLTGLLCCRRLSCLSGTRDRGTAST